MERERDGGGWFPEPDGISAPLKAFLDSLREAAERWPPGAGLPINSGALIVDGFVVAHVDLVWDDVVKRCIEADFDGNQLFLSPGSPRMGVELISNRGEAPVAEAGPLACASITADWFLAEIDRGLNA